MIALRTTPRTSRVTILDGEGRTLATFTHRDGTPVLLRSMPGEVRAALEAALGMHLDPFSSWPLPAEQGDAPNVERKTIAVFSVGRDEHGVERIDRRTERRLCAVITHVGVGAGSAPRTM